MSLDVYLVSADETPELDSIAEKIFIREDGQTKEISREEWDERNPGREPMTVKTGTQSNWVYSANITHNLAAMAQEVDLYTPLWRPEEIGITQAWQLVRPLTEGLKRLLAEQERLQAFNPSNGWGNYELLLAFAKDYLAACEKNPTCRVETWR